MKITRTTVVEALIHSGKERIALRLVEEVHGLLLERVLLDPSQRSQTQVLSITNLQELHEFIENDPYYPRVRGEFDHVRQNAIDLYMKRGRGE